MKMVKQDFIEIVYVIIGGLFGVSATILVNLILIATEPTMLISSSLALLGVSFGIYKIFIKLSKGTLVINIIKIMRKLYGLDRF
jgi:hypothetical protein